MVASPGYGCARLGESWGRLKAWQVLMLVTIQALPIVSG